MNQENASNLSEVTEAAAAAAPDHNGFSRRFETRPEFELWGSLVPAVVNASGIRERLVDDLKVFRIADVFAGGEEIFIGFGLPNAYLVTPDGKGGYQKFAGKSLKRAPSRIEDTRGWVQSGILIRFKNLPPEAAEKLRAAMVKHNNIKFWTCVNAILNVMESAGFTHVDGKPLSDRYMPYALMHHFMHGGIQFQGKTVEFDVVRTTSESLQRFATQVVKAEAMTFCRHADRAFAGKAKGNKALGYLYKGVHAPFGWFKGKSAKRPLSPEPVAPAMPKGVDYATDLNIRVAQTSMLVAFLRQFWGPHALFEATQTRVRPADYLPGVLKEFPQPKPSFVTRVKKRVLFSKTVIAGIRRLMAADYITLGNRSESDINDMVRTDSAKVRNRYNIVITDDAIILARINVKAKIVDWILSKHVLISGYNPFVRFAGECWKDEHGVWHLNRESGTYQPSLEQLRQALAYIRAVFPHWTVVADELEQAEPTFTGVTA